MGRGRGRGFRGGRQSNRGRSGKPTFSKKESTHLRQFGERHPAEDGNNFQPKKFKPDRSNERNQGQKNRFGAHSTLPESSESESEEEATPYSELLGLFSGQTKKKEIRVDSESESGDEEEAETDLKTGDNEEEGSDSNSDGEGETSEASQNSKLTKTLAIEVSEQDPNVEADLEADQTDLPDETVIEDAELDPELNDEKGHLTIDPFLTHFEREMPDWLQNQVRGNKIYSAPIEYEWTSLGRFLYTGMVNEKSKCDREEDTPKLDTEDINLSEVQASRMVEIPAPPETPPPPHCNNLNELPFLKSQLHESIVTVNKACLENSGQSGPLTSLQNEILQLASKYHDLYFPQRSLENADEIRLAYCIHAANHILKTRIRIIHHNAKMAEKVDVPDEFRDQGFVRPKILILTPFKHSALRIVNDLISLLFQKDGTVQNKKRFLSEYSGETLFMPKTNPKPRDHEVTFAGNVDDNFKIGLAVTKKSIKLYTGFYGSDIIIASPLGLRLVLGAEGEKGRDFDFLSSIEVLIADQADVFLMQNWDHVLHLMRHLHLQPITTHGTDFARIRPWQLDGFTKNFCQTLIFSSIICPEHNALFSRYCKNYAGLVKVINPFVQGSISQITVQLPQLFQQFECANFQEESDARFKYFVETVLPNFSAKLMSHTLIFVSSYFDFVRLRNYFKREKTSFVQICEYTKDKKIARARDLFFHGQAHFMLYTERSHFFRRLRLKGIGHVIFYQLPYYSHFYPEICNLMQEENQIRRVRQRRNNSVNVVYGKYDASRLTATVGTRRANHMLSSDKTVHAFVSSEGGEL